MCLFVPLIWKSLHFQGKSSPLLFQQHRVKYLSHKFFLTKQICKQDKPSYAEDFGDSDQEDEPDAYLARVKAEAEERDEGDGGESEDESTDEDFNPDQQESDVAEE